MWFFFSVVAMLCWSGSDLFSKIGCMGEDRFAYLKMVTAVGTVFGLHSVYEVLFGGVKITADVFLTYLPVSLLYISSMAIGYLGLRYIELSVSSPICNSSGAVVAVLCICTGLSEISGILHILAIIFICLGVILLGIIEVNEDSELKANRRKAENVKYTNSFLALLLPIIYCLLDALGTFADGIVLNKLNEDSANVAYELTFFILGVISFVYVKFIKKEKYFFKAEKPKYIGAIFETAGQFAYIYAISDSEHIVYSAPVISSYCALSVLWSRLFLKEKLTLKHYAAILITVIGIAVLGLFE